MSTTDDTNATRRGSGSNDLLGQASEALPLVERLRLMSRRGHWPLLGDEAADEIERLRAELARCGGDNCMGRRCDDVTNWVTEQAAQARVAAERERRAKLCEALAATGPLDEERALHAAARRIRGPNAELSRDTRHRRIDDK